MPNAFHEYARDDARLYARKHLLHILQRRFLVAALFILLSMACLTGSSPETYVPVSPSILLQCIHLRDSYTTLQNSTSPTYARYLEAFQSSYGFVIRVANARRREGIVVASTTCPMHRERCKDFFRRILCNAWSACVS
jgi:hypothetical protein